MELHHKPKTKKQFQKIDELLRYCKDAEMFIYDHLLIRGNSAYIAKEYVMKNPSKSFRQWLIDSPYFMQEID